MLSIDTIRAKAEKKVGEAKEYAEALPEILEKKLERDLLLTQRKWVDRTAFWGSNMVNNHRLNKMERIVDRTDGRIEYINGDIEIARRGMEAELKMLERQRERGAAKGRPTDLIDEKIARRQQINEERIAKIESKREGLLSNRGKQEKIKDSFVRTRSSIANEMNDKLSRDIALVENQFNFQGLKYKESILSEELVKMDADVAEIQKERDQFLADAAELGQHGRALRLSLRPLDAELKRANEDRNKVFAELSKINKRISSVEAKKSGWEDLRTSLGVTKEAVPADRAAEAELMRARSKEEQIDRFRNGGALKNLIAKQVPDSYIIEAAMVGEFFKDIRDNQGFNQLKPEEVRREANETLRKKRKAGNEAKLLVLDESEKIGSLEKEKDSLWEYVFQKLANSSHMGSSSFIEDLVAGSYPDMRDEVINKKLRGILENVGYAFDTKQYNANKNSFSRILLAKANARFAELMRGRAKNNQDEFFRSADHQTYINGLVDKAIQNGDYLMVEKGSIDELLDKNGFDKIRYGDVADYINARTEHLLGQMDGDALLNILRKDKVLIKLLKDFGYRRGSAPQAHEVNFLEFYKQLVGKGFAQLVNDDRFKNIVMNCADRNMELNK